MAATKKPPSAADPPASPGRAAGAPRRVLIIKPSSLGDIVHALPVLHALRQEWPQARISWLIAAPFAPLLEGHPQLDELIIFDRRRYGRMLRSPAAIRDFCRFVLDLRARKFDLVIDLQGLFRSGFLAWASGAARRIGFAAARELAWMFYTHRVRCADERGHAVTRNLDVANVAFQLSAAGQELEKTQAPRVPLPLRPADAASAKRKLDAAASRKLGAYSVVLPGARWSSKLWSAAQWCELIDMLHGRGEPPVVLLGAPDDAPLAAAIAAGCRAAPTNLVGRTTLPELVALLAGAAHVYCLDSGPMHIAAALGTPLTAIFGPTDPRRTGPWSDHARVVALPLPCAPCLRRRCPLGHHDCMRTLPPERVLGPR